MEKIEDAVGNRDDFLVEVLRKSERVFPPFCNAYGIGIETAFDGEFALENKDVRTNISRFLYFYRRQFNLVIFDARRELLKALHDFQRIEAAI